MEVGHQTICQILWGIELVLPDFVGNRGANLPDFVGNRGANLPDFVGNAIKKFFIQKNNSSLDTVSLETVLLDTVFD